MNALVYDGTYQGIHWGKNMPNFEAFLLSIKLSTNFENGRSVLLTLKMSSNTPIARLPLAINIGLLIAKGTRIWYEEALLPIK